MYYVILLAQISYAIGAMMQIHPPENDPCGDRSFLAE
jgi:hypothetical protein